MSLHSVNKIEKEIAIKSIQLGDYSVGKTLAVKKYVDDPDQTIAPTIGVAFSTKSLKVNDDNVRFMLFDTSGQERYLSITKAHIRQAEGIALFFDVTRKDSFDHLKHFWKRDIDDIHGEGEIPIVLVANKIDLPNREVSTVDGARLAVELKCPYFETSAETGEGIEEVFNRLAQLIIENKHKDRYIMITREDFQTFPKELEQDLNVNDEKSKKSCECQT